MLKTKNFGRKSLNEIKDILVEMGLGFGIQLDSWPPDDLPELPELPDYPEVEGEEDEDES